MLVNKSSGRKEEDNSRYWAETIISRSSCQLLTDHGIIDLSDLSHWTSDPCSDSQQIPGSLGNLFTEPFDLKSTVTYLYFFISPFHFSGVSTITHFHMNMHIVFISALVSVCLASALGILEYGTNDVKGSTDDKYELKPACSTLIRAQVNTEMHASLVYMNMAAHFDQNSVARKGFAKLFRENSEEEREHAQKLIDFLNIRGSKFGQFLVDMPEKVTWRNALEAINDAILLEKDVYNQLYHIHDVADLHCKDAYLMDFLEREYFEEQVKSIDSLSRIAAELGVMSDHVLGEYLYDKKLLHHHDEL